MISAKEEFDKIIPQPVDAMYAMSNPQQIKARMKETNHMNISVNKNLCITDNPNTLFGPLIGFDPATHATKLQNAAHDDPARERKLFVIVRGTGGGKTRAMEEIRMELSKAPATLCLPITFNSSFNISPTEQQTFPDDQEKGFVLAVITRLVCVLYNIDFYRFEDNNAKCYNAIKRVVENFNSKNAIQGFLLHATGKVKQIRQQSDANQWTVVIMVDEVLRALDCFPKRVFVPPTTSDDLTYVLREAMIRDFESQDLAIRGVLLMSSLQPRVNWTTTSTRSVKMVHLAEKLDPERVLDEWWFPETCRQDVTDVDRKRALVSLLASAACSLPRVLEHIKYAINEQSGQNVQDEKDAAKFVETVWNKTITSLTELYPTWSASFSSEFIEAVVFGKKVNSSNEDVGKLLRVSAFTNSLTVMTNETFVPETSLLYVLATNMWSGVSEADRLSTLAGSIFNRKTNNFGDALEECMLAWFCVRLDVMIARRDPNSSSSLALLLGLGQDSPHIPDFVLPDKPQKIQKPQSKLSATTSKAFFEALMELQYPDDRTFVYVCPAAENDIFDALLVVRAADRGPFLVFVDHKANAKIMSTTAGACEDTSAENTVRQPREKWLKKVQRVAELATEAKTFWDELRPNQRPHNRNALCAFSERRCAFAFFSTHQEPLNFAGTPIPVVHIFGKNTKTFFGPMWEWYMALERARGVASGQLP